MEQARSAIVTGAGKRVGAELARALLSDGWTVVAHVRDVDDPVPDGAIRAVADLARSDCADRIFKAVEGQPPVRLLVNNAAHFAFDRFGAFDCTGFDTHMAVNVRAPILLIDRFAAADRAAGDALIVNILDAKLASPNPDFLSYTISKQALAGATELGARALAGQRIRVNAIAPSLMLRSPGQSDENFNVMHRHNPLGRAVEPDDVISALRYLIDARAVTGQTIVIDGGQRFLNLERDVQFLAAANAARQPE